MTMNSVSCPLDGKVLSYFDSIYTNVFIVLHPFIGTVTISPEIFYPETYPTKSEILNTCRPVSWSEVSASSGLKNIAEIDIGLRSRIHGLKKKFEREDWAKVLDNLPNLICPTEGCFSPFTENRILAYLKDLGYSKVVVRDEHLSQSLIKEINDLEITEEIPYAGSILTEDGEIYATTHWDSHFSFLCFKSKEMLGRFVGDFNLEGFLCDQNTEVYWSVRNLTLPST